MAEEAHGGGGSPVWSRLCGAVRLEYQEAKWENSSRAGQCPQSPAFSGLVCSVGTQTQRFHSLENSATSWGPNVEAGESVGAVSTQAITRTSCLLKYCPLFISFLD